MAEAVMEGGMASAYIRGWGFVGPLTAEELRAAWNAQRDRGGTLPSRYFVSKAAEAEYAEELQRPIKGRKPYKPGDGYVFSFNGAPVQGIEHWPDGLIGMLMQYDSPVWSTPE